MVVGLVLVDAGEVDYWCGVWWGWGGWCGVGSDGN